MPKILAVASAKGGVGKTTIAINLAYTLSKMGKNVLLVDVNYTAPDVSTRLGIPYDFETIHDMWLEESPFRHAVYNYTNNLKVAPGKVLPYVLREEQILELAGFVKKGVSELERFDTILLDTPPGLGVDALANLSFANNIVLVTTPELASMSNTLRTKSILKGMGVEEANLGLVINKSDKSVPQFSLDGIAEFFDLPEVLANVPVDKRIEESTYYKKPFIAMYPKTRAGEEIKKAAARLAGYRILKNKPTLAKMVFGKNIFKSVWDVKPA